METKLSETAKQPPYQRISKSLVAAHPNPRGVVQFYGGQLFGSLPATSYDYFLATLYNARYSLIVTPFEFSSQHCDVATKLLNERNNVYLDPRFRDHPDVTHFWIAHSLGCKFIALLEAFTDPDTNEYKPCGNLQPVAPIGILDQPSLFLAPDIGDTDSAIPVPILAQILDRLGLGIVPKREQMLEYFRTDTLFNLFALISFKDDNVAGNPDKPSSDVADILKALKEKHTLDPLLRELKGGHMVPFGVQLQDVVFEIDPKVGFVPARPLAELEQAVLDLLESLEQRKQKFASKRQRHWREAIGALKTPVESGVKV